MLFTLVYTGMALAGNWAQFGALFFLYGIYAAFTEGVAKAWISNVSKPEDMATAIGTYEGFRSLATLLASALAGLVWQVFGATVLFGSTAVATLLIMVYFIAGLNRGLSRQAG